jgi:hypothetical protein
MGLALEYVRGACQGRRKRGSNLIARWPPLHSSPAQITTRRPTPASVICAQGFHFSRHNTEKGLPRILYVIVDGCTMNILYIWWLHCVRSRKTEGDREGDRVPIMSYHPSPYCHPNVYTGWSFMIVPCNGCSLIWQGHYACTVHRQTDKRGRVPLNSFAFYLADSTVHFLAS